MKHRILIAMHYMEIGGAESSLIGLLDTLNPNIVDVDLFIYWHRGVYMSQIPKYINILPENKSYSMIEKPMKEVFYNGFFLILFARIIAKIKSRIHSTIFAGKNKINVISYSYLGYEVNKVLPDIQKGVEYDLAISYSHPHEFVLNHVMAKKKIAWIHTDYSKINICVSKELLAWSGYDKIISISEDVTKSFVELFPSLNDKILLCENILSKKLIVEKSLSKTIAGYKKNKVLTLCSVGRIGYAKNYDNIPRIAKKLSELLDKSDKESFEYVDFSWYIIGPGEHKDIDTLCEQLNVKYNIIFMGPTDNPYPYIKNCDIYVHPSRYEGKSVVVREAQILCKPVIITNYKTARSQILNETDGIICELDNEKIAYAIYELANNKPKQEKIISYLRKHDYSGTDEIKKIYRLLD